MNDNALAVYDSGNAAMTVQEVKGQVNLIQQVMREVMKPNEHYGTIPGCGNKPALLKAGAEKIAMTFRFSPKFEVSIKDLPGGHREYNITTSITHIPTGAFLGEGLGSASTMETKYRYRKAEQKCPQCGEPAIIRGKKEYGGGWLCYKAKGGCGAKFNDGDSAIENQEMGRVEHDNPADYYNTCMKMAKKRSLVDAILTATAASDIFTQDIDDSPELYGGREPVQSTPPKQETKYTPPATPRDVPPAPPAAAGEIPPATDSDKSRQLSESLLLLADKTGKSVRELLAEYTSFTGKDGKEHHAESVESMKPAWVKTTLHKVQDALDATATLGDAIDAANGETPPDYTDDQIPF